MVREIRIPQDIALKGKDTVERYIKLKTRLSEIRNTITEVENGFYELQKLINESTKLDYFPLKHRTYENLKKNKLHLAAIEMIDLAKQNLELTSKYIDLRKSEEGIIESLENL